MLFAFPVFFRRRAGPAPPAGVALALLRSSPLLRFSAV